MEYKLGDEVMIIKQDNFMENIKSGNITTGKLVFIRLLEEDGKIVDTSYANTKDGKTIKEVILGARDEAGNHYSYSPVNKAASDYRIIPKKKKES